MAIILVASIVSAAQTLRLLHPEQDTVGRCLHVCN